MGQKRDRAKWLKIYGHLYIKFGYRRNDDGLFGEQACAYCGTLANSTDHVPPLQWVYALGTEYFEAKKIALLLVPACLECNETLSSKRLFTLRERCSYLIDRYSKKHNRLLRNTVWTSEELDELGRTLRPKIESFAICQLSIDRRIQILEENVRPPRMP